MNESIEKFYAEDYITALIDLEKCFELLKYKAKDDTVDIGAMAYFAGIFAYNAKNSEKALNYFELSIKNEYEIGTCHQYMAQVLYEKNDSLAAEKVLKKGNRKYPEETKIIYSLIYFYTSRDEYEKAIQYIEKAIEKTPDYAILYIIEGNAYSTLFEKYQNEYLTTLLTGTYLQLFRFYRR